MTTPRTVESDLNQLVRVLCHLCSKERGSREDRSPADCERQGFAEFASKVGYFKGFPNSTAADSLAPPSKQSQRDASTVPESSLEDGNRQLAAVSGLLEQVIAGLSDETLVRLIRGELLPSEICFDDADLIRSMAFEELMVVRREGRLLNFFSRYGWSLRAERYGYSADDLLQETYCHFLSKRFVGYDSERGSLDSYVFCVARNLVFDKIRRMPPPSPSEDLETCSIAMSDESGPVAIAIEEEQMALFRSRVEELPEPTRTLVRGRLAGKTLSELAEQCSISVSTASRYVAKAAESLRLLPNILNH